MTRIAVIDDDQDFLAFLAMLFDEQGWDLLPYAEAEGIVGELERRRADVVLLDLWLGASRTGWEVLRQLKQHPATRAIPVVICSAAGEDLRGKAGWLAEHGIPVLRKPFDLEELAATLDTALGGRSTETASAVDCRASREVIHDR